MGISYHTRFNLCIGALVHECFGAFILESTPRIIGTGEYSISQDCIEYLCIGSFGLSFNAIREANWV